MSSTPLDFRGRSGPTRPLSHERLLAVCYAYRTLHDRYVRNGGQIDHELYQTMLTIESEIISWEQRSAKLRYEAKRQRNYRLDRAAQRDAIASGLVYDEEHDVFVKPSGGPGHSLGAPASDDLDLPLPTLPDATLATLRAFREARGLAPGAAAPSAAPDTSTYRKSGLV